MSLLKKILIVTPLVFLIALSVKSSVFNLTKNELKVLLLESSFLNYFLEDSGLDHIESKYNIKQSSSLSSRYSDYFIKYNVNDGTLALHKHFKNKLKADEVWYDENFEKYTTDLKPGFYDVYGHDGKKSDLLIETRVEDLKKQVLLIVPDLTWQAYNNLGGWNFYDKFDSKNKDWKKHKDWKKIWLSNFRPVRSKGMYREFATNPYHFLVKDCGLAVDLVSQSTLLKNISSYKMEDYKMIVIYGHDEYWPKKIKNELQYAINTGTNLLNMAGNAIWWEIHNKGLRIKRKKNFTDVKNIIGVTWKEGGYPIANYVNKLTEKERKTLSHEFGMKFGDKILKKLSGIKVLKDSHEIFKNTDLNNKNFLGTKFGVNQVEIDGVFIKGFEKNNVFRYELLGESWVWWGNLRRISNIVDYQQSKDSGRILSFSTVGWVYSLVNNDNKVKLITKNAVDLLMKK